MSKGDEIRSGGARRALKNVVCTILILAAAAGVCFFLRGIDGVESSDAYVSMVFVLAVLLVSRFTDGYRYGVTASLIGVLAVNYVFTYPYFEFNFFLPGYPIAIACMLAVSILTCTLTARIKQQEQARRDADREMIRGNLLRAISHDLRTPLTSILGANSALMENGDKLNPAQRQRLHEEIENDAQWLIRMVENLLTITRIRQDQDRAARIEKTPELVEEVVAEAVAKFCKRFPEREIRVHVPEQLLVCPMDAMLIEQVLVNLLENVVTHAENATEIDLTAAAEGGERAVFTVSDNGCGVRPELLKHLFEDWGRVSASTGDSKRNMGIGLSVCNAIIKAHGGRMWAKNRPAGGLSVSFTLPMEGAKYGT